jgi:hypothetical protein
MCRKGMPKGVRANAFIQVNIYCKIFYNGKIMARVNCPPRLFKNKCLQILSSHYEFECYPCKAECIF